MVLIRQNRGAKIILHAESPTFRAAKLKGFTVLHSYYYYYYYYYYMYYYYMYYYYMYYYTTKTDSNVDFSLPRLFEHYTSVSQASSKLGE